MTPTGLAIFALAILVGAGAPGPSVAAVVSRVLVHGLRDVLPFLAALWLGEAAWLTVTVFGLAAVAERFGTLFVVLKACGALYLLWLAWRLWTAPSALAAEAPPAAAGEPWRMAGAGLLVSLGNPKNMVFYLALLPTVVDLGGVGVGGWAALVGTLLVVLAAIDLTWALGAVAARRLLASPRGLRVANRLSAAMMAGAAAAVAVR